MKGKLRVSFKDIMFSISLGIVLIIICSFSSKCHLNHYYLKSQGKRTIYLSFKLHCSLFISIKCKWKGLQVNRKRPKLRLAHFLGSKIIRARGAQLCAPW